MRRSNAAVRVSLLGIGPGNMSNVTEIRVNHKAY
jgi:hypothetical protein